MGTMKLVSVGPSSLPAKKYAAIFELDGKRKKTVHFGAAGYGDFIIYSRTQGREAAAKHRRSYLARHSVDPGLDDPTTPAALSYYVTWGPHPSLAKNVLAFRRRFRV